MDVRPGAERIGGDTCDGVLVAPVGLAIAGAGGDIVTLDIVLNRLDGAVVDWITGGGRNRLIEVIANRTRGAGAETDRIVGGVAEAIERLGDDDSDARSAIAAQLGRRDDVVGSESIGRTDQRNRGRTRERDDILEHDNPFLPVAGLERQAHKAASANHKGIPNRN